MAVLFLIFENVHMFSIVATPIYIPTNSAWGDPFLHIFTNTCYFFSFWWQPFWLMWGSISLRFWFANPWWLVMLSIFYVPVGHLYVFFGKCLFRSSAHFLIRYFFNVDLCEFFVYFVYISHIFFIHLFIDGLRLISCLAYCKYCCNEHGGSYIFLSYCFHFLLDKYPE